jgi:hypothetical protein
MKTKAILFLKNSTVITSRHGNKSLKFAKTTGDLLIAIKLKARNCEQLVFNCLAQILSQYRVFLPTSQEYGALLPSLSLKWKF